MRDCSKIQDLRLPEDVGGGNGSGPSGSAKGELRSILAHPCRGQSLVQTRFPLQEGQRSFGAESRDREVLMKAVEGGGGGGLVMNGGEVYALDPCLLLESSGSAKST